MLNGEATNAEYRESVSAAMISSSLQSLAVNVGSCLTKEEGSMLVLDALLDAHVPYIGRSYDWHV